VRGLTTVITGPYIEVLPGSGVPKTGFIGVEQPSPALGRSGLPTTLATAQLGSVRPRTAVIYRGIEVGTVTTTTLSRDATVAHVQVLIDSRYARLVRIGSRFWSASGVDVNVSLFKGVEISVESLRSLVAGGVAFATPDAASPPAREGTLFVLHDATWEFKLRRGVKFHNGEPLTAEDVKYSFDRVTEPGKEKKKSPQYGNIRAIKEVRIVDPDTIHIVTDKPFPLLLERLVYFC